MTTADRSDWDTGYAGPGTYRHKKGGVYHVHGLGEHEGTGEQFVVYQPAGEGRRAGAFWIRPRADFDDVSGGVARFVRIG